MKLEHFKDWHRPDDCIVVAPGPSLMASRVIASAGRQLLAGFWTIAANRAATMIDADYVVCFEPAADPIWSELDLRGVSACFTHRPTGSMRGARKRPPPQRSVNVDSKDVRSFLDPGARSAAPADVLKLAQSTFYALAVAAHLGFRNIGLMGADMSPDRFGPRMDDIEHAYTRLRGIIERRGQRVWNLSEASHLESFQRARLSQIRVRDGKAWHPDAMVTA